MEKLSTESFKELQEKAPNFIETVDNILKNGTKKDTYVMVLMLDSFAGEPYLFYIACHYAYDNGVTIQLVPPDTATNVIRDDTEGLEQVE